MDSTWKNFVVNRCVCYCLHVFVKELLKVMNNQFFRCYWVQTEKKKPFKKPLKYSNLKLFKVICCFSWSMKKYLMYK